MDMKGYFTVGNVQCIHSMGHITKYKAVDWYSEILA